MALRGSLAEINIWDLVHLLRASGGSGELIVAGLEAEARLQFDDGKLVGASTRHVEGREVLEAVLLWGDGEFEFRRLPEPVSNADASLDTVLAELEEAHRGVHGGGNGNAPRTPRLAPLHLDDPRGQQLGWFVESQPLIEHACLIDTDGGIRAQSSTNLIPINDIRALAMAVACHVEKYPRPNLRRMTLEDERGIVVLTTLPDGSGLLVVADPKATVGAVCAAANRFVAGLED
ncbi:MAG: DUF4388 domain-containing protein [Thermoanaerobaculaceae bacterium]